MMALRQVQRSCKFFVNQLTKLSGIGSIRHHSICEDTINIDILGESHKFPLVWLRDNCQCEKCFHPSAKSRIIDWSKFDINVKATNVTESDSCVKINWNDGHTSQYHLDWLKLRSFFKDSQKIYNESVYKPPKIVWHGKEFETICKKHDYNDILSSDKVFYDFLHALSVYGVALIENAPHSEKSVDIIVNKIGFPRQTHYGSKFIVQNVANTSNVAYLSSNLQIHIDLPYYEYCPGVNMLHCLVQTESAGGENILSDSHFVANYMKENHPNEYKLLTDTEVEWMDIGVEHGNEFFKLHRAPVICLDKNKQIIRTNFSIPQRGNYFPCSIDDVKSWYHAHHLFLELSHKFSAKFKTKQGQILAFDNIRLLHGRNAYEDTSSNVRKLVGTYIDWDEVYSRLRCLKLKLFNLKGI